MKKVNYGFDAPGIMRNLIVFGILIPVIGILIPYFSDNIILKYCCIVFVAVGIVLLILGTSMFGYGIWGKFVMRDYMLKKIDWK